jgi:hypothetical protein
MSAPEFRPPTAEPYRPTRNDNRTAPDRVKLSKSVSGQMVDFGDAYGTEYVRLDPAVLAALPEVQALIAAERERLGREVNMARYGQPDFAWSIHREAMADLKARLAKAVEALRAARVWMNCVDFIDGNEEFARDIEMIDANLRGVVDAFGSRRDTWEGGE